MIRRFRPYFRYLRPQRGLLIAAILCGILAGIASGFGLPYMVKKTFPAVFAVGATPLTAWELTLLALWIPAVFVVRGVATYLNTYFIQLVGTRVLKVATVDKTLFAMVCIDPEFFAQSLDKMNQLSSKQRQFLKARADAEQADLKAEIEAKRAAENR